MTSSCFNLRGSAAGLSSPSWIVFLSILCHNPTTLHYKDLLLFFTVAFVFLLLWLASSVLQLPFTPLYHNQTHSTTLAFDRPLLLLTDISFPSVKPALHLSIFTSLLSAYYLPIRDTLVISQNPKSIIGILACHWWLDPGVFSRSTLTLLLSLQASATSHMKGPSEGACARRKAAPKAQHSHSIWYSLTQCDGSSQALRLLFSGWQSSALLNSSYCKKIAELS